MGTGILAPDVWLPLNMVASEALRSSMFADRSRGGLEIGGRLKPGVLASQAAEEIAAIGRAIDREYPNQATARGLRLLPSSRVPGNRGLIAAFMTVLMIVVGLVLAVACANVAGILLARGAARRRELAVPLAIGAGRARLVRQLLTETMMLFGLGGAAPDGQRFFSASWNIVEPGYFGTLGIPLVAGRDFRATDVAGAQPVVVIGEGAARRCWPGQPAIGKYRSVGGDGSQTRPLMLVIGVARDVKSSSLIDGLADSFVYLPLQQHYAAQMTATMTIAARARGGGRLTDEIRTLVASMDPNLTIVTSQTLEDSTALGLVPQRIAASVSGTLGGVGLLLAAIGIYGVTAYTVARRTREIGIRIALGAERRDIVGLTLRHGMVLAAIGSLIGLALAAAVSQLLSGYLFGVPAIDPLTFAGTTALFAAVGLTACYLPARRATTIDPLVALREE